MKPTKLTNEQLQEIATVSQAFLDEDEATGGKGDLQPWLNDVWPAVTLQMARELLESRADAEPVSGTQFRAVADLYSIAVPGGRSVTYSTDAAEASDFRAMGWAVQEYVKLERLQDAYLRPQPAPVVPDELLSAMEEVLRISDRDHEAWNKAKVGIVSCRAAMLQGGK